MASDTSEAVRSEPWLSISSDCVLEFLRMDSLDVKEADLVRALIRWGKFQVQTDGGEDTDSQKLRSKIMPGLNLIRFAALSHVDFAQLCLEELGAVLSGDEKHSVMMSIVTGDWNQMPAEIAPVKLALRRSPYVVFHLTPNSLKQQNQNLYWESLRTKLSFYVNKKATLAGLAVAASPSILGKLSFDLMALNGVRIGGSTGEKFSHAGDEFFKVTPNCIMDAETAYELIFSFSGSNLFKFYCSAFSFPTYAKPMTSDWLTMTISTTVMDVNVQKIVFKQ